MYLIKWTGVEWNEMTANGRIYCEIKKQDGRENETCKNIKVKLQYWYWEKRVCFQASLLEENFTVLSLFACINICRLRMMSCLTHPISCIPMYVCSHDCKIKSSLLTVTSKAVCSPGWNCYKCSRNWGNWTVATAHCVYNCWSLVN